MICNYQPTDAALSLLAEREYEAMADDYAHTVEKAIERFRSLRPALRVAVAANKKPPSIKQNTWESERRNYARCSRYVRMKGSDMSGEILTHVYPLRIASETYGKAQSRTLHSLLTQKLQGVKKIHVSHGRPLNHIFSITALVSVSYDVKALMITHRCSVSFSDNGNINHKQHFKLWIDDKQVSDREFRDLIEGPGCHHIDM